MLRNFYAAVLAILLYTVPAHAAVFSFDFGTAGQTSGTVTYDTVLGGPGYAPDSRLVTASFSNLYLNGTPISGGQLRANISQAGTSGGEQLLIFNQFFTSPFFPRADFNPAFSLTFASATGSLFSSDGMLAAPGVLAGSFESGTAGVRPGEEVSFGLAVSAVPEPAAWAFMIVGIAGVGATLRRRGGRAVLPQIA